MANKKWPIPHGESITEVIELVKPSLPNGAVVSKLVPVQVEEKTKPAPSSRSSRRARFPWLLKLPDEQVMAELPVNASIAFAIRCGYRFLPFIEECWVRGYRHEQRGNELLLKILQHTEGQKGIFVFDDKLDHDIPLSPEEFSPHLSLAELKLRMGELQFATVVKWHSIINATDSLIDIYRTLIDISIDYRKLSAVEVTNQADLANRLDELKFNTYSLFKEFNYSHLRDKTLRMEIHQTEELLTKSLSRLKDTIIKNASSESRLKRDVWKIVTLTRVLLLATSHSLYDLVPFCKDYERLLKVCKHGNFNDEIILPQSTFEPLWKYGKPPWLREDKTQAAS